MPHLIPLSSSSSLLCSLSPSVPLPSLFSFLPTPPPSSYFSSIFLSFLSPIWLFEPLACKNLEALLGMLSAGWSTAPRCLFPDASAGGGSWGREQWLWAQRLVWVAGPWAVWPDGGGRGWTGMGQGQVSFSSLGWVGWPWSRSLIPRSLSLESFWILRKQNENRKNTRKNWLSLPGRASLMTLAAWSSCIYATLETEPRV